MAKERKKVKISQLTDEQLKQLITDRDAKVSDIVGGQITDGVPKEDALLRRNSPAETPQKRHKGTPSKNKTDKA